MRYAQHKKILGQEVCVFVFAVAFPEMFFLRIGGMSHEVSTEEESAFDLAAFEIIDEVLSFERCVFGNYKSECKRRCFLVDGPEMEIVFCFVHEVIKNFIIRSSYFIESIELRELFKKNRTLKFEGL